jgi:ribosomal protein S18 acetylase RimI-like enzyme
LGLCPDAIFEHAVTGDSNISLRATTADDREFLSRVYASTRAEELKLTDWSDQQKAAFCLMQFNAQSADYAANYSEAQFSIIERDGTAIGRLIVDRRERVIHVVDIALLPEGRGEGTGTRLLQELMEEASQSSRGLSIHVEKFNRALQLYLRLGFRPIEDKGIYLLMQWP